MIEILAEKIADGLMFGEGIRWTGADVVLSDMIGRRVVRVDPQSGAISTLLEVESQPNGLVVQRDGSILVLSMFDRKILRVAKDGAVSQYADLESVTKGYLGDVVQARNGDLYVDDVGARVLHGEPPSVDGSVFLVKPDGSSRKVLGGIAFPNGIQISPDGRRLYLNVSLKTSIQSYDLTEDGSLVNERMHADLSDLARPDGMALDNEEGVWPCMLDKSCVLRISRDGQRTHSVLTPGFSPVAAAIGGSDGRTMYITAMENIGDKNIFEEMRSRRVKSSIWRASVPFSQGD